MKQTTNAKVSPRLADAMRQTLSHVTKLGGQPFDAEATIATTMRYFESEPAAVGVTYDAEIDIPGYGALPGEFEAMREGYTFLRLKH